MSELTLMLVLAIVKWLVAGLYYNGWKTRELFDTLLQLSSGIITSTLFTFFFVPLFRPTLLALGYFFKFDAFPVIFTPLYFIFWLIIVATIEFSMHSGHPKLPIGKPFVAKGVVFSNLVYVLLIAAGFFLLSLSSG